MTSHVEPAPPPATKLAPPRLHAPSVRADQLRRVAAAAKARLVLVRAPAGAGKSTLIAAAAAKLHWRYAWYRLDRLDADPERFFAALEHALAARSPEAEGDLSEPHPLPLAQPLEQSAAGLAAALGRTGGEFHLILDDYEALVGERGFNRALAALLSYLPSTVHLVLLSRARPSFPTGKLALEGGLSEIGYEELRFDAGQVAEVCERDGRGALAPASVEALLDLTDGWPAGVTLAASASTDGVEQAVHRYLDEQVYARQAPEVQEFLKRTCCLPTMSVALAEEVGGVPDAGSLLSILEAQGAFTYPGPAAGEFRYHSLLRSFLQTRVAAEGGRAALNVVRCRSAEALARAGKGPAAVELYLSAGEPDATVALLREKGHDLLGECGEHLLSRWASTLEAAGPGLSGWAALVEGHRYFVVGDLVAARRRQMSALKLLEADQDRYLALRALADSSSVAGADDKAVTYARRALEAAGDRNRAEGLHVLARLLSIACRWRELDEALAAFADCGPVPDDLAARMLWIGIYRDYGSGDVRAALGASESAIQSIGHDASVLTTGTFSTALANFNLFACRYGRGAAFLEQARQEALAGGPLYARAQVEVTQAAFLAQQGRLRECVSLLDDLAADPLLQTNATIVCLAHLTAATALRRAGEHARAIRSCRRALESLTSGSTAYDRLDVQIDLTFLEGLAGGHRHASARLRALCDEAERSGLRFQTAKGGLFLGVLALRAGEDGGAELTRSCGRLLALGHLDCLGQELAANPEAVSLLASTDIPDEELREMLRVCALQVGGQQAVASVATQGDRVLPLLLSLVRTDLPEHQATLLLQALRRHPSKEVRNRARRLDASTGAAATRLFLELTPREEEILALLAEGCSNAEVARRLVLSVGTVKTHVHRILTKTGASGRLAAAMLYRQRLAGEGTKTSR